MTRRHNVHRVQISRELHAQQEARSVSGSLVARLGGEEADALAHFIGNSHRITILAQIGAAGAFGARPAVRDPLCERASARRARYWFPQRLFEWCTTRKPRVSL